MKKMLDCNGKVAYTAILVAVWKLIQLHEHHIGTEIDLEKRLYSVFDEYNIELDAKEAVFMATVEGSSYEIHFKTFPEDVDDIRENSKAKIEKFTDKYDLVYVQTDAHSTDFEPEKMAVRFDLEELKSQFTDDFADPIDIAKMMKSYSSKRLALKNKKNKTDQIDIDSEVAMNTYCMECVGESYVHGYNVQQGGILIAMKKNGFMKDRILSNISKSIVESFTTTISSIKFQLFQPGMGASVLDEHVINSIDISHQTTVPVNTKTTIKRRQTIQTSVPEETDTCSESDSDMFVNEFSDIDSKRHKSEEEEPHDETFDD